MVHQHVWAACAAWANSRSARAELPSTNRAPCKCGRAHTPSASHRSRQALFSYFPRQGHRQANKLAPVIRTGLPTEAGTGRGRMPQGTAALSHLEVPYPQNHSTPYQNSWRSSAEEVRESALLGTIWRSAPMCAYKRILEAKTECPACRLGTDGARWGTCDKQDGRLGGQSQGLLPCRGISDAIRPVRARFGVGAVA